MTEKKLIPFDLDRAIAGDPLITRDGRKVIKFHYFACEDLHCPIVAHIENELRLTVYWKNGKYYSDYKMDCDLFMAPKTKTYWANVYKDKHRHFVGVLFTDEKEARSAALENVYHVKTISFEVEE